MEHQLLTQSFQKIRLGPSDLQEFVEGFFHPLLGVFANELLGRQTEKLLERTGEIRMRGESYLVRHLGDVDLVVHQEVRRLLELYGLYETAGGDVDRLLELSVHVHAAHAYLAAEFFHSEVGVADMVLDGFDHLGQELLLGRLDGDFLEII